MTGVVQGTDRVQQELRLPDGSTRKAIFIGPTAYFFDERTGRYERVDFTSPAGGTNPRDLLSALTRAQVTSSSTEPATDAAPGAAPGVRMRFSLTPEDARRLGGKGAGEAVTLSGEVTLSGGRVSLITYTSNADKSTVTVHLMLSDFDVAPPVQEPPV